MTDHGVSDSDMPTFPWPAQPEARTLDALLAGNFQPEQAPDELRSVAEVLAALQAPPDQREVAGWGEALTVYRQMAGRPGTPGRPRPRRRRPGLFASLLHARVAAAAGALAIAALGGGVAAAYTGSLPAALQRIAHEALAAPGARVAAPTAEGSGHPAGPSVANGLCDAYQHGTASQRAVAFHDLVRAAGGADKVAAYCASVPHAGPAAAPGRRVGQTSSSANPGHGRKPTAPPGKPTKPPGKPSTPPGKPTASPGNGNGHGNGGGNGNGK